MRQYPGDAFVSKLAADESWMRTLTTRLLKMAHHLEPKVFTDIAQPRGEYIAPPSAGKEPANMISRMEWD